MINALFMLSYMLASLLSGQVAKAQKQVSSQLQLDPIVLFAESESRAIEPQNIDTLLKLKGNSYKQKKSFKN
jgi:hypothetical protein